jgi:CheY-like chemotaxis protein
VISSFGEFVLERLESGTEVYDDMQEVLSAAGRAENLTSQLLAYSRRRPVAPTVLNVNDRVADVDKMLRRLLGDSIELRTDLAPDLWDVRIDASGLEQVVVNLVVNARDAMPDGGRLAIETANASVDRTFLESKGADIPPGRYVTISVTDTGVGMDDETRARLFEPFFTTKAPGKGTGLGLATCYGIVKQAGGFIWVYSERGRGTTFRVLLPSLSEESGSEVDSTQSEKLRGNETILVVEDDDSVRRLVVRLLAMLGYDILEANGTRHALEVVAASRKTIHAVLTDIVMEEEQGPELVAQLAVSHPGIKVIYMSGYTRGAIELDETIVLVQKPFSRRDLAKKVREVLDRPV